MVAGELAARLLDPDTRTWLREQHYGEDGLWDLEPYFTLIGWDVPIGLRNLLRSYLTILPPLKAAPGEPDELRHF